MKANYTHLIVSALCLIAPLTMHAKPAPQLGDSPIAEVIAALTLQEKVSLLIGTGMEIPGAPPEMQGPVIGVSNDRVPGAAGTTFAIPRLGIPSMVLADGPAGLRIAPKREDQPKQTFYATAFPVATLLASSWDTELVEQVGRAMGDEVKEYGVDILLAPALNIHRFPLGGRNFEYYSEDPLVSGKMAAAMINGVQSRGVGTSIKHFVANNHEWNRNTINVRVDERALREIYLKGFEIAVKEGQPWTLMSSYNKLNGTYTSERADLLTTILRDQWKFDGFVMTDWFGGRDALAQMNAGNDLLMPGTKVQHQSLVQAVEAGDLDESVLDRNIELLLTVLMRTPVFKGYKANNNPDLEGHALIARTVASEGMVLLQNTSQNKSSALPLSAGTKLGLFGNNSYQLVTGGTGSGDVNEAYSISLLQGIEAAGFSADNKLTESYRKFISAEEAKLPPRQLFRPQDPIPERNLSEAEIHVTAAKTDLALITIGRNSGEFADREAEGDFYLDETEKRMLASISKTYHEQDKQVVVILNIGGVIETSSWRHQVDAILLAWQPGQEAGYAIADILSGETNPSGKLATTFAHDLEDYPAAENFPGVVLEEMPAGGLSAFIQAKRAELVYKDSIRVGYRAFITDKLDAAYAFGFGLSYTKFEYSALRLSNARIEDTLTASITITNTGKVAGREVVQLYVSAPQGNLKKPAAELRAFGKTRLLEVGESQIMHFDIGLSDLSSFDPDLSLWTIDPGQYTLKIGASSTDIRAQQTFHKTSVSTLPP